MARRLFTVGVAPFEGSPETLRRYIRAGKLGEVTRIADSNATPLLTPKQVDRANQIVRAHRNGGSP